MDTTVIQGPWLAPAKPRDTFGQRNKLSALAGGFGPAIGEALGRDRVSEAGEAAAKAAKADLDTAFAAKLEFAAATVGQLAQEAHMLRHGRAATTLMALQEKLETLAAECEP